MQCGALLYKEMLNMTRISRKEAEAQEYATAEAETKYYDMLYNFFGVVSRANEQSFAGYQPRMIAKHLRKSAAAFCNLCMIDSIEPERAEEKAETVKQAAEEKKALTEDKEKPTTAKEPEAPETLPERPKPGNFLQIENGWGLCPVCSSKVLRVTMTTRLENFPVYCKRCRAEHLVNWWNAEHQRIEYKRYINDSHLRDQALKGTGLQSFRNNRCSATERVAVKYSGS